MNIPAQTETGGTSVTLMIGQPPKRLPMKKSFSYFGDVDVDVDLGNIDIERGT